MSEKVNCKNCENGWWDSFRGVLECMALNCYCHYDNCEPGQELTTPMIPEVGVDKCPGVKHRVAHK